MIFFGHLGIGKALASAFRKGLPTRWLLLGTVLPDLVDKPLYYGLVLVTGKRAAELGMVSGTRTFGHTAIFVLMLGTFATLRRSRKLSALSLGIATHLLLDGLTDYYFLISHGLTPGSALLWPLNSFPVMPHPTLREHVGAWRNPFLIVSEVIGVSFLVPDFAKARRLASS